MKNLILKSLLAIVTFLGFTAIISCGDDNSSSGSGMDSIKKIVSMKEERTNYITYYNYEYDNEGRISKVTVDVLPTNSYNPIQSYNVTYTYTENTITITRQGDIPIYSYTLHLSNGKVITDDGYHENYAYDENGYLSNRNDRTIVWGNNNLTLFTISKYTSNKYTYTSIPWPENYFFRWEGTHIDPLLEPAGFYGNMPKNLPATVDNAYSLNYTIEGGCITKVVWKNISNDKEDYVYTFIWK